MIQPCKTVVPCAQTPNPVLGFNSETPDVLNKIGVADAPSIPPPLNSKWQEPTALVQQDVPVTTPANQATANLIAESQATQGAAAGWTTQDDMPIPTFQNGEQSAVLSCPGGSLFTFGIVAGLFSALTQAEADQKAASFFTRQQQLFDGCLNGMGADTLCLSTPGVMTLAVTGASFGNNEYTLWAVTGGTLPPGMKLNNGVAQIMGVVAQVTGTPTVTGSYSFTVRATTPAGTWLEALFTINVVGVTSGALPPATEGAAYSAQLVWAGFQAPVFSIAPGSALPAGLTMSSSGLITGTPTASGSFSVSVEITDPLINCQQTVTISVSAYTTYTLTPALNAGYTPQYFDGGANFPAGIYQISYVTGAVQAAFEIGTPWQVNSGFAPAFFIYDSSSINITLFPPAMPFFASQAAAEAGNNGQTFQWNHSGGQIGLYVIPNITLPGSTNPTFQLTRLS